MRRIGGLWEGLTGWSNLHASFQSAARGKHRRADVAVFELNVESELAALRRELIDGTYRPGEYRTFAVRDPKPRLISAAPFRDRVVHHALTRVIEPVFERRFTTRSFASRKGYGTHLALQLAVRACGRYRFSLQCDIRKYFPSIDHLILKQQLRRALRCARTLDLADLIIDRSNPQEAHSPYFPGDTLFTPFERRRGLPLGNQSSQFFANVYLNWLDQFVLRELKPAEYVRYVDDFVLFGDSEAELLQMRRAIVDQLAGLRLVLHAGKSRVYRTQDGLTLLGWRITPAGVRLKRSNVVTMRRRLGTMAEQWRAGEIEWAEVAMRINSWIGHARHGDTWRVREQMFDQFPFRLGGKRALPSVHQSVARRS